MSFNRTSELIGVSRFNSNVLNANRFVNLTLSNDLNVKLRDLRDEKPSILISGSCFIPFRSLKDVKIIS